MIVLDVLIFAHILDVPEIKQLNMSGHLLVMQGLTTVLSISTAVL